MTMELPETIQNEANEAFSLFDKDSSGAIQTKDLGLVLRSLGYAISAVQLQQLEHNADPSQLGFVKQDDFMRQVARAESLARESDAGAKISLKGLGVGLQQLLESKSIHNSNMEDSINAGDFRHVMTRMGEKISQDEFTELCKDLEIVDGRIKISTLIAFLNLQ